MPLDPVRWEETSAWLDKARKDLSRARTMLTLEPPDTEDCLFHCQQAVEKALKSFLVWHDQPFRKTHDIVELARLCLDLEPALGSLLEGLGVLTRFAWEYRYPGETEPPGIEEATTWVRRATEVVAAVEKGLLPQSL